MASEIFSGPLPPNEDVSYKLLAVMIIFLVMTTSFFILRMYAKIKITRSIGWDDHLMTAAWVFLVVNQSLTYASMTYGVGRHVIYIPPLRLEYAAKLNYVAEIIEVIDLYLVKASLAILVLRMKPRPLFRWMMYGCLALLTAVNLAAVIIELAQCRPIQLNWNRLLGRGSCWSGRVLLVSAYLVSATSILTDLLYITIPIFHLWNVQIHWNTKVGILGLISVGVISIACSIACFPFIPNLVSKDATFDLVTIACLKYGELYSTFIVGCLPPMFPLFQILSKRLTGNSSAPAPGTWESRTANKRKGAPNYEMLTGGKGDAAAMKMTPTPSVSDSTTDTVDTEAANLEKGIRKTSEFHVESDQGI